MKTSLKHLPQFLFAALLVASSTAAVAQDSPLLLCRAITDNTLRLACYDALVPAALVAPSAPAAPPGVVVSAAPATAAGTAAAAPAAGQSTLAAMATKIADTFGMASMGKSTEPDSIESYIPGAFDGWRPNMRINLANGQVWRVIDESEAYISGDNMKVKLVKGFLGNVIMEFEGSNRTASVKRVK